MRKIIFFILFALSFSGLFAQENRTDALKKLISQKMRQQEVCWNLGQIDCFMKAYLPSDSLVFLSPNSLNFGYKKVLENYKNAYPGKDEMGKLAFQWEFFRELGETACLVIGKWKLSYPEKEPKQGRFSLVWQEINGNWYIVADHTH